MAPKKGKDAKKAGKDAKKGKKDAKGKDAKKGKKDKGKDAKKGKKDKKGAKKEKKDAKGKKDKKGGKKLKKDMSAGEFLENIYPPKARWATMGGFAVLCIGFIVVSCILYYQEVTIDYKGVGDQFEKLRQAMADVRNRDDLRGEPPPKTATEAGKLKSYIQEKKSLLESKKAEYKNLFGIGARALQSWIAHGKTFYYHSKGRKTWYDAEKFCLSRDSHLTSILSEDEQKFISSQIKWPIWIGLTDEKEKGMWEWTDSSSLTTQFWSNDKPIHSAHGLEIAQHCVSLSSSNKTKNWNRDDCYTLKNWMCKRTLNYYGGQTNYMKQH